MNEWFDTTLVAIGVWEDKRAYIIHPYWRVYELPAQSTQLLMSQRKFGFDDIGLDRAEQFLGEQYPEETGALWVQMEDIKEEIARRSVYLERK